MNWNWMEWLLRLKKLKFICEINLKVKIMKRIISIIVTLAIMLLLSGCADNVSLAQAEHLTPVGFWYGFWHGSIMGIAFIVSIFDSDVTIYATYNSGWWYNFGYVLGAGVFTKSACSCKK
jgi:hypothetical protein